MDDVVSVIVDTGARTDEYTLVGPNTWKISPGFTDDASQQPPLLHPMAELWRSAQLEVAGKVVPENMGIIPAYVPTAAPINVRIVYQRATKDEAKQSPGDVPTARIVRRIQGAEVENTPQLMQPVATATAATKYFAQWACPAELLVGSRDGGHRVSLAISSGGVASALSALENRPDACFELDLFFFTPQDPGMRDPSRRNISLASPASVSSPQAESFLLSPPLTSAAKAAQQQHQRQQKQPPLAALQSLASSGHV
ncbi:hypothetical protein GGI22_001964, partial [Coemansia erecta]